MSRLIELSGRDLAQVAKKLYRHGPLARRKLQQMRPYFCPFEVLIDFVPPRSSILDVGCGSGLFLGLLAFIGRISYGRGFDASATAIALASEMQNQLPANILLVFEHRDVADSWPHELFDVVSIIDLLHHIPANQQESTVIQAASKVIPGGILLYKDMVMRPIWRAWANRFHDLIFAREWINYVKSSSVSRWASEVGLVKARQVYVNRFCYGHEIIIFVKPF